MLGKRRAGHPLPLAREPAEPLALPHSGRCPWVLASVDAAALFLRSCPQPRCVSAIRSANQAPRSRCFAAGEELPSLACRTPSVTASCVTVHSLLSTPHHRSLKSKWPICPFRSCMIRHTPYRVRRPRNRFRVSAAPVPPGRAGCLILPVFSDRHRKPFFHDATAPRVADFRPRCRNGMNLLVKMRCGLIGCGS
jgi:hypothetical protein